MPIIHAWGSTKARCGRCLTVLSGWYPTRRFALEAAERHSATVRDRHGQIVIYCAECGAQIGGAWLEYLPRPKEMEDA